MKTVLTLAATLAVLAGPAFAEGGDPSPSRTFIDAIAGAPATVVSSNAAASPARTVGVSRNLVTSSAGVALPLERGEYNNNAR